MHRGAKWSSLTTSYKLSWSVNHSQLLTFLAIIKLSLKLNWKLDRNIIMILQTSCWTVTTDHRSLAASGPLFGSRCPRPRCQSPHLDQVKITFNLPFDSSYGGPIYNPICHMLLIFIFPHLHYSWKISSTEQDRSWIQSIKTAPCSLVQKNPGIAKQNLKISTYCRTNFCLRKNVKVQALLVNTKRPPFCWFSEDRWNT